jgi:hypothetical protein
MWEPFESMSFSPWPPFTGSRSGTQLIDSTKCRRAGDYEICVAATIIVLARGTAMDYVEDKVDEMVLALLYFTTSEERAWGARAWKSHNWDALDRLHAKEYISDSTSNAKSVVLSAEGVRRARELLEENFGGRACALAPNHRKDIIPKSSAQSCAGLRAVFSIKYALCFPSSICQQSIQASVKYSSSVRQVFGLQSKSNGSPSFLQPK